MGTKIVRIRGARRGKGCHRTRLGDAFFENLPVHLFAVIEQHVLIVRNVLLPFNGVDADLPDQPIPDRRSGLHREQSAR